MSLEHELAEASVVLADYRERCAALEQLVRDYEAEFARVAPFTHKYSPRLQELRQRAREEAVDIKEPGQ